MHHSEKFLIDLDNMESESSQEDSEDEEQNDSDSCFNDDNQIYENSPRSNNRNEANNN